MLAPSRKAVVAMAISVMSLTSMSPMGASANPGHGPRSGPPEGTPARGGGGGGGGRPAPPPSHVPAPPPSGGGPVRSNPGNGGGGGHHNPPPDRGGGRGGGHHNPPPPPSHGGGHHGGRPPGPPPGNGGGHHNPPPPPSHGGGHHGGGHAGPVRSTPGGRWNSPEANHRRDRVRIDRDGRRSDMWRTRERIRADRHDWSNRRNVTFVPHDVRWVRSDSTWYNRFGLWERGFGRPVYPTFSRPIRWYEPMPSSIVDFYQVEVVARNLEALTRSVYDEMDQAVATNPNREYAGRLLRVLSDLSWAAENFLDSVYDGDDYGDSLNDLFYLESQVNLAVQTLSGYSREYLVADDMAAIRYYVNELLWQYRQNY